jgi:hypothetical protein
MSEAIDIRNPSGIIDLADHTYSRKFCYTTLAVFCIFETSPQQKEKPQCVRTFVLWKYLKGRKSNLSFVVVRTARLFVALTSYCSEQDMRASEIAAITYLNEEHVRRFIRPFNHFCCVNRLHVGHWKNSLSILKRQRLSPVSLWKPCGRSFMNSVWAFNARKRGKNRTIQRLNQKQNG